MRQRPSSSRWCITSSCSRCAPVPPRASGWDGGRGRVLGPENGGAVAAQARWVRCALGRCARMRCAWAWCAGARCAGARCCDARAAPPAAAQPGACARRSQGKKETAKALVKELGGATPSESAMALIELWQTLKPLVLSLAPSMTGAKRKGENGKRAAPVARAGTSGGRGREHPSIHPIPSPRRCGAPGEEGQGGGGVRR